MTNIISFPNLGGIELHLNPVALSFGNLHIYWYGIIIVTGIIFAFFYTLQRAKQEQIQSDHIYDLAIFVILFGILGARLFYVAATWKQYSYRSFYDIIAVWNGGLAIYGGIIAGALVVVIFSLIKKIRILSLCDALAPAVMAAQAIGRWGNFVNAEAYGSLDSFEFFGKVFSTPWAKNIPFKMTISKMSESGILENIGSFHPTFLYESVWNLIGFLLIHFTYKKKKYHGQVLLMYLTWYGFGRMFIEGLRTDSLPAGNLRISQLLAFICFVVGSILLIAFSICYRKSSPILVGNSGCAAEPSPLDSQSTANAPAATDSTPEKENDNHNPQDTDDKQTINEEDHSHGTDH